MTSIADILLDMDAVLVRPESPITLTGGALSPVYVDCRKIIGFPEPRRAIMAAAVELLERDVGPGAFDVVAGGETAGIPFAAWLSEALDVPMAYVRKKPKGFGKGKRIEGVLGEGARTLLVEDLATDGQSKLSFIDGIRETGGLCAHCFVVFHYGIFPESEARLSEAGVALHALATWADIFEALTRRGEGARIAGVEDFFADPEAWRARHR